MWWLIRISSNEEPNLIRSVNVDFDGIIVDLTLASLAKNMVASVYADVLKSGSSIVAVDPNLTPLTCLSPEKKESVRRIFELSGLANRKPEWKRRPLDVSILTDDDIKVIAEKVINLQRELIQLAASRDILRFFGITVPESEKKMNYILLTPYFAITSINEPEHHVNLKLLEYSIRCKRENEQLYAVIAFSRELLEDEDVIEKLINDYSKYSKDVDGYAIWIVDFEEISEDEDTLFMYVLFLDMLKQRTGKPIINLYGDYFSLLLTKLSLLDGIVTRICYRQRRRLCPSERGGRPPEEYYLNLIKTKVPRETAEELVNRGLFKCDCPICQSKGGNIADLGMNDLRKHFLYAFSIEVNHVASSSIDQLLRELEQCYERIEPYVDTVEQIYHLVKWYNVITEYIRSRQLSRTN